HVPDRVEDDQPAHPRDDQHHHERERVDEDLEADVEVPGDEPRVERRRVLAIGRVLGPDLEERPDCPAECDESRERRDDAGRPPRDHVAGERDQERRGERGEEADPGTGDGHPRSTLAWSTSRATRRLAIATMSPSPTATSPAATAMTASAKIWPLRSP